MDRLLVSLSNGTRHDLPPRSSIYASNDGPSWIEAFRLLSNNFCESDVRELMPFMMCLWPRSHKRLIVTTLLSATASSDCSRVWELSVIFEHLGWFRLHATHLIWVDIYMKAPLYASRRLAEYMMQKWWRRQHRLMITERIRDIIVSANHDRAVATIVRASDLFAFIDHYWERKKYHNGAAVAIIVDEAMQYLGKNRDYQLWLAIRTFCRDSIRGGEDLYKLNDDQKQTAGYLSTIVEDKRNSSANWLIRWQCSEF